MSLLLKAFELGKHLAYGLQALSQNFQQIKTDLHKIQSVNNNEVSNEFKCLSLTTILILFIVLKEKKSLLWRSHNLYLPYTTVEEYFIISITFHI